MIRAEKLANITWQHYYWKYEETINKMDNYIQYLAAQGFYSTVYSFSDYQEASFIYRYCEKLGYHCTLRENLEKQLNEVKISWEHLL